MARNYKLVLSAPATATAPAKTWEFGPGSGRIIRIGCSLKKDPRSLAIVTAAIHDPGWLILSELPDPAFANISMKLSIAKEDGANVPPVEVFDGKVESYAFGYPAPTRLTVVGYDKSVDLRRQAHFRSLKGLSSRQLAERIAAIYGLTVDAASDLPTLKQRIVHLGIGRTSDGRLSDWDYVRRALEADGLECYVKGSNLRIRRIAGTTYTTKFVRGQPPVLTVEGQINHVAGPGALGDVKKGVVLENQGTKQALSGTQATEATRQSAGARTHRAPVSSPATSTTGAHSEDPANETHENVGIKAGRRKDSLTIHATALPDFTLEHTATLEGWGAKVDGVWYPESVDHVIVGDSATGTTIPCKRGSSTGSKKQAGIA